MDLLDSAPLDLPVRPLKARRKGVAPTGDVNVAAADSAPAQLASQAAAPGLLASPEGAGDAAGPKPAQLASEDAAPGTPEAILVAAGFVAPPMQNEDSSPGTPEAVLIAAGFAAPPPQSQSDVAMNSKDVQKNEDTTDASGAAAGGGPPGEPLASEQLAAGAAPAPAPRPPARLDADDEVDEAPGTPLALLTAAAEREKKAREADLVAGVVDDKAVAATAVTAVAATAVEAATPAPVSPMRPAAPATSADAGGNLTIQQWAELQWQHFSNLPALPLGWIRIRSGSGRIYFANTHTGVTQLDEPLDLPPGWTKQVSRSSGRTYYFNAATGQNTFDVPST